jgi:LmbE family N-acetylglucosaminyl deacetylase
MLTLGWSNTPSGRRRLRQLASAAARSVLRIRSSILPAEAFTSILVFAPHPDDETLGCGGTVSRLAASQKHINIIFVTDGGASHPEHPLLSSTDIIAIRKDEARAATGKLGVEWSCVTFIGARDGELASNPPRDSEAIVLTISRHLTRIAPDAVFLTCRRDGSTDHDATFVLVQEALKRARLAPRIFEYPIWAWRNPLLLIGPILKSRRVWRTETGDVLDRKVSALEEYVSQTRPIPPDSMPVISSEFTAEFMHANEYFFER